MADDESGGNSIWKILYYIYVVIFVIFFYTMYCCILLCSMKRNRQREAEPDNSQSDQGETTRPEIGINNQRQTRHHDISRNTPKPYAPPTDLLFAKGPSERGPTPLEDHPEDQKANNNALYEPLLSYPEEPPKMDNIYIKNN